MIIDYNVNIVGQTVEFNLNSATEIEEIQDGFLTVVRLGEGFFGRVGYGELLLMVNENSSGTIVSPTYESEQDRLDLVNKIHSSIFVVNNPTNGE